MIIGFKKLMSLIIKISNKLNKLINAVKLKLHFKPENLHKSQLIEKVKLYQKPKIKSKIEKLVSDSEVWLKLIPPCSPILSNECNIVHYLKKVQMIKYSIRNKEKTFITCSICLIRYHWNNQEKWQNLQTKKSKVDQ